MIKQQLIITFIGMGLIVSPISIAKCYRESRTDPTMYEVPQVCVTSAYEQRIDYRLYMNEEIDKLDKSDRKQWYLNYKSIQEKYKENCPIDETKSIHSVTTNSEFDLLARLVEAEIEGGNFDEKCNVASTIINRYRMYAPRTWQSVVYEKNQYTPI
jgi:spore germination cell wall hydrolase CwlJ-like protein